MNEVNQNNTNNQSQSTTGGEFLNSTSINSSNVVPISQPKEELATTATNLSLNQNFSSSVSTVNNPAVNTGTVLNPSVQMETTSFPTNVTSSVNNSVMENSTQNLSNPIHQKEFSNDSIPPISPLNTNSTEENGNSSNDNNLLRDFIGKNYEKLSTRKFNFSAFFFSVLYGFYRKMYLYSILWFVVASILIFAFSSIWIGLILNVFVGFVFNPVYMHFVDKKVYQIQQRNAGKSMDELRGICNDKGGTSVLAVFVGIFILFFITVLIVLILTFLGFSIMLAAIYVFIQQLTNYNLGTQATPTPSPTAVEEVVENGTYNGILLYDTSIVMSDHFTIQVPSVFEDDSDTYDYDYSYDTDEGVFDECSVNLSKISNFSQADNLISQMAQYYHSDTGFNRAFHTKINDIEWYWFSDNSSFGTTYYYATSKNNELYLLQYEIEEDAGTACDNYREEILKSIQKK